MYIHINISVFVFETIILVGLAFERLLKMWHFLFSTKVLIEFSTYSI